MALKCLSGTWMIDGPMSRVLPSVRLSPNAMNFVLSSWGTGVTITEKLQRPLRARESVASHVTVVVPFLNSDPAAGAQATVTGGAPLAATGIS